MRGGKGSRAKVSKKAAKPARPSVLNHCLSAQTPLFVIPLPYLSPSPASSAIAMMRSALVPKLPTFPVRLWRARRLPTAMNCFCRYVSSTSHSDQKPSHVGTEALPFRIAPAAALHLFREWQRGVLPLSTGSRFISISRFFCPFWAFSTHFSAQTCVEPTQTIRRRVVEPASLLVYAMPPSHNEYL